ncbi:hypothetical protein ACVIGB_001692 [Bradyrhizobium sp. USDA 4341]
MIITICPLRERSRQDRWRSCATAARPPGGEFIAVVVAAKPDPKWGEVLRAVVELTEGARVAEPEIIAFCRSHCPAFKTPKAVMSGTTPKISTENPEISAVLSARFSERASACRNHMIIVRRQTQRAMPYRVDEGQNFCNRGVRVRQLPYLVQTRGKHTGAAK